MLILEFSDSSMALTFQTILTSKNPNSSCISLPLTHLLKSRFPPTNSGSLISNYEFYAFQRLHSAAPRIAANSGETFEISEKYLNGNNSAGFDAFLSGLEFLCLISSATVSVFIAVRFSLQKGGTVGLLGSKILVWQCVILVCGLMAGVVIRRRQWRRICGSGVSRGPASSVVNLLERVEKLEQELYRSTTIIHALSRRLEKLGIRFRVTRKTLKDPIAETAALVQKTSEATQSLAVQGEILEKELGEIQKVLLAMQEQQQKQLELILAIGKTGKLWGAKSTKGQYQKAPEASERYADGVANSEVDQMEMETLPWRREGKQQ